VRAKNISRVAMGLAAAAVLMGAKCPGIPKSHEINLTIVTSDAIELEFPARGGINVEASSEVIDVGALRDQIEDAGIDLDGVESIAVSSVTYGVTAYNETETDRRMVDARVTLRRSETGPEFVLIDELSVDVYPLLGELVPAPIHRTCWTP